MKKFRPVLAALVIAAGLVTLLASSLTEEEEPLPPVPVTVGYTLTSTGSGLSRDLETRRGIVTALRLAGSYDANSGAGLSLDRSIVNLNATSSFDLEIVPVGEEELAGTAAIDITSLLDFGLRRNPTDGQLTSDFGGTTTIVDVTSSGVDLQIGDAPEAVSLSWSDFVARENDANADLDERMASAAYNMLSAVLRAALIVQDAIVDTEANREVLEGMGVNSGLDVECDNLPTDGGNPAEFRLTWTLDAVGAGQGELGAADSFTARYQNCRNAVRNRYLDGSLLISGYSPDRGDGLRTLGASAEFRDLYNSETVVDFDTTASAASPIYDGTLTLNYIEAARATR